MDITTAGDTIIITNATEEERKDIRALKANRPIQPHLLCRNEVAEILRCHPKTVERHAKAGLIKQIRIGRRQVRYDAADIAAFYQNGSEKQELVK